MSKAVVLCADDYALTAPVSRAILDLAKRGRISAVSCMTASPLWPEHGPWLREHKDKVDIGLHVTLVDEAPLTKMPKTAPGGRLPRIGTLILNAYAGRLALDEIAAEIEAQAKAFAAVMGFAPAHIDGHLHAHVLPGIRGLVFGLARRTTPQPWVRNIGDRLGNILRRGVAVPKAAFLASLGRGFDREASDLKNRMNDSFSGVYAFSHAGADYAPLFARFLRCGAARHLILCHPGAAQDDAAWSAQRAVEYDFLAGDGLTDVLRAHDARIARFADAIAA